MYESGSNASRTSLGILVRRYVRAVPDPPLPPSSWLRAFEAAARHLSFTLAAADLHGTRSAVSQHVRNLQALPGRALFVRRPRALQLTEAGANCLPTVREAFEILAGD